LIQPKKEQLEYLKQWRKENPDYMKGWEKQHPERKKYHKQKNTKYKIKCIEAYGGKCKCCSEERMVFLCVDHINNDGNIHRKKLKTRGGSQMYLWLIGNDFPEGFQVLCMNCNHAKRFGICPHTI